MQIRSALRSAVRPALHGIFGHVGCPPGAILHFDATLGFTDQTGNQTVTLIGSAYPTVVAGYAVNASGAEWGFDTTTGPVRTALLAGEVTLVQVVTLPLMSSLTDATDYSLFGDLLFVRRDGTAGSFKCSDGTNVAVVAKDWSEGEVCSVVCQCDGSVMRVAIERGGSITDRSIILVGDSITATNRHRNVVASSMASVDDIVSVTTATAHGAKAGEFIYVYLASQPEINGGPYEVLSALTTTTLTFEAAGVGTQAFTSSFGGGIGIQKTTGAINGYFERYIAANGHRVTARQICAVPGAKATDWEVAIDSCVPDKSCKFLHILIGINDIVNGKTTAQVMAALASIAETIPAGVIIIGALTPIGSGYSGAASVALKIDELNAAIEQFCSTNGYIFADYFTPLVDDATGYAAAGILGDNLHPTSYGHKIMSGVLAAVLNPLLADRCTLPSVSNARNLFTNKLFASTTAATGTGVSGTKPTTGILTASAGMAAVSSLVDRADAAGKDWVIECASSSSSSYIQTGFSFHPTVTFADDRFFWFELEMQFLDVAGAPLKGWETSATLLGGAISMSATSSWTVGQTTVSHQDDETVHIKSSPALIKAGTSIIQIVFGANVFSGAATSFKVKINRVAFYHATAEELARDTKFGSLSDGPWATCDGILPLSAQITKGHTAPIGTGKITVFPGIASNAQIEEAK